MNQPTPAEMQAHVVELCEANDIAYAFRTTARRAYAGKVREGANVVQGRPGQRAIVCPEIRSYVSYLVALHELGHHLGPEQKERRIIQEIAAWEWAIDHARCKLSPAMKRRIGKSLKSYVSRYLSGYGYGAKQAWLPAEDDRPDIHKRLVRLIEGRYRQKFLDAQ